MRSGESCWPIELRECEGEGRHRSEHELPGLHRGAVRKDEGKVIQVLRMVKNFGTGHIGGTFPLDVFSNERLVIGRKSSESPGSWGHWERNTRFNRVPWLQVST